MQAVSKDGRSADNLMVTLQVLESSVGSLEPLLALKASTAADGGGAGRQGKAGGATA